MKAYGENDPWNGLRRYTAARIALGGVGVSQRTRDVLAFRLAHAEAQDAVLRELDAVAMAAALEPIAGPVFTVESRARDKEEYLKRPDLGRRLSALSAEKLAAEAALRTELPTAVVRGDIAQGTVARGDVAPTLTIVVADGLSSPAVERQALPFLTAFLPLVRDLGPVPCVLALRSRVALGDEVGALLGARVSIVLIGERPGLSSPDGLGLYLTYGPRVGNTDEKRNCVSNIRAEGFPPHLAAVKAEWLLRRCLELGYSGVALKDEQPREYLPLLGMDATAAVD